MTRYSCPLPDCGWARDVTAADGLMGAEVAMREHADHHSALEYLRALTAAREETTALETERDQYRAAARHFALRIRHTAHVWITTLPETIRTAAVVDALSGIASAFPDRPHLRDDLWMRIAGAYEARFENDGHPEDARHAADEAMEVVKPVVDELRAEIAAAPGAWGSVWLHGDWQFVTGQMETEQREHAAAAVLRWMHGLDAADGRPPREEPEGLRWWRTA